jgi:hypothetical protein
MVAETKMESLGSHGKNSANSGNFLEGPADGLY